MSSDWIKVFHETLFIKNDCIKAQKILDDHSPEFLYQYRKGRIKKDKSGNPYIQDLENLKRNIVWGSPANKFNDPYDCNILAMTSIAMEKEQKNLWDKDLRELNEVLTRRTYVSCFCECESLLPMWSYYANYHEGFCICYRTSELQEFVAPVNYENCYIDMYKYNGNTSLILKATLTKDPDWRHEKEWRMVSVEGKENVPKNGKEFSSAKPAKIFLGCKSEKELIKQVTNFCESEKIDLYRMSLNNSEYKLIPENILKF